MHIQVRSVQTKKPYMAVKKDLNWQIISAGFELPISRLTCLYLISIIVSRACEPLDQSLDRVDGQVVNKQGAL